MGYSDILRNDDHLVTIRTIGRVAQLLLDLRAEYERRPNETTIQQIRHRIRELNELERQLDAPDVRIPR